MSGCPAPGCGRPVTGNGVACHQHFVDLVPGWLSAAWFRQRKSGGFTAGWLRAQVVHVLRGEAFSA